MLAASCAAVFAFGFGYPAAAAQQQAVAEKPAVQTVPCGGAELARGRIESVVDGANFRLDDGRFVHLAGVEVPLPPREGTSDAPSEGAAASWPKSAVAQARSATSSATRAKPAAVNSDWIDCRPSLSTIST